MKQLQMQPLVKSYLQGDITKFALSSDLFHCRKSQHWQVSFIENQHIVRHFDAFAKILVTSWGMSLSWGTPWVFGSS